MLTCLATPYTAHATLNLNSSQTVAVDYTAPAGQNGATVGNSNLTLILDANVIGGNGADGANGGANNGSGGGYGFFDTFNATTLTINAGKELRAGNGGNGGNGAASAGGSGATGRNGIFLGGTNNFSTINGNVYGGSGGNGGTGSGGAGGNGGASEVGFYTFGSNSTHNISGLVQGGNGGNGGNALSGTFQGGTGASGAAGFSFISTGIVVNLNGTLQGGNGGNGGNGSGAVANRNGGAAGNGVFFSSSSTLNILSGGLVQGGNSGAVGTGGSGAAGVLGAAGHGVYVFSGNMTLNVSQGGVVRGGSTGSSEGAGVYSLSAITSLDNAGSIVQGRNGANAVYVGSGITTFNNSGTIGTTDSTAAALFTTGTISNFTNSGNILAGSGNAYTSNGVTNFENRGLISSETAAAIVFNTGGIDNTLDNTGGIISSGVTGNAGTLQTNLSLGGKTLTGGTLRNTAGGNAIYSILPTGGVFTLHDVQIIGNIRGTSNVQEYALTGNTTLDGDMDLGLGANTVLLNGNFTSGSNVDFMATSGTLGMTIGALGNVAFNGEQETANNISTLSVDAGGRLNLNENFTASGALTNNGTITLGRNDSLTVGSMLAGGAGNAWNFTLRDQAELSRLIVGGGNAVNFTNSTIAVDASQITTALPVGSALLIADGGSAAVLDNLSGFRINDNSVLLNFTVYRGDNAAVTLAGADSTQVYVVLDMSSLQPFAQTAPQLGAAAALDSIGSGGDAGIRQVQAAFASRSDAADIQLLLEQLIPQDTDAITVVNSALTNDVGDLLYSRLTGQRGRSAAADDLPSRLWAQGFGSVGQQGAENSGSGYDTRTGGFAVGADTNEIFEGATIGAALTYGHTTISQNDLTSKRTESDTVIASLYGDYDITQSLYLEALLSGGFGMNDTRRIFLDERITGDFETNIINAQARLNHMLPSSVDGFTAIPFIQADYTYFSQDSYAEQGPGGLQYSDSTSRTLAVGAGVKLQWTLENDDSVFVPYLNADYNINVVDDRKSGQVSFAGAPGTGSFSLAESSPSPAAIALGGGVDIFSEKNIQFTADYSIEKRADYTSHGGFVRASYRF